MSRGAPWGHALLLVCLAAPAQEPLMPAATAAVEPVAIVLPAEEFPRVVEIVFEGNRTTQPRVMRREMVIREGDAADPDRIERSRQGIQDLGLFRRVSVRQIAVEGGVRLVFTVREKFYVLAYPRLSANLDGQSSFGAELRWNNVFGLDHSLRARVSQSELQQTNRGTQTNYFASYAAPFLGDSPYSLSVSAGHSLSPVTVPVVHDETFDSASFLVSRTFSVDGPASQGWTLGSGLAWENEKREGPGVPPAYGEATSLVLRASFRDIRFRVYSEEGVAYGLTLRGAREGFASDYNSSSLNGNFNRYVAVGETPHQNVNFGFEFGTAFDVPVDVNRYNLGGGSALRAYDANFLEGDAYYLLSAEYVRPLGRPWLRGAVIGEAGNLFQRTQDSESRVYGSLGLALRLRVQWFVNLEIEFGYAIPLDGGEGRVFGGRV